MYCGKEKMKVAMVLDNRNFQRTMHPDDLNFLKSFSCILNDAPYPDRIDERYMEEVLENADACISCWGTPMFVNSVLDKAPHLKLIAHAAGTPRAIVTDAVWERGIRVFTAAPVIATDVAETTLGAIIVMNKSMLKFNQLMHSEANKANEPRDNMKRLNGLLTVGIVGATHVGRNLIRLLKPFGVRIKLYDPYITEYSAHQLGVEKVALEDLMSDSDVVTIHAPSLPQTKNMINKKMLALMKDGGVFINTSRGAVVDQKALIEELQTQRISAYLDVFEQEPLPEDSPLRRMDNVLLTPHMSGGHTVNGSYERGNYVVRQLYSYYSTGILQDEVVRDMMEIIA